MDQHKKASEDLAKWCRKMGFLLPDGTVPPSTIYADLTLSTIRQRLFQRVIENVHDRRKVLKVRRALETAASQQTIAKRNLLQEDIKDLERHIAEVERETDIRLEKIAERVRSIKSSETAIENCNTKFLLVESRRRKVLNELQDYSRIGEQVKNIKQPPSSGATSHSCQGLIHSLESEVKERLRDPGLKENISKIFGKSVDCNNDPDAMWQSLVECGSEINDQYVEAIAKAKGNFHIFEHTIAPPPDHWIVKLAKLRMIRHLGISADLLSGQGKDLNKDVLEFLEYDKEGAKDLICDYEEIDAVSEGVQSLLTDTLSHGSVDVEKPEALRIDLAGKVKTTEMALESVTEMSNRLKEQQQENLELQRYLLKSSADWHDLIRGSESSWRELLRRHQKLHNDYAELLVKSSLDSLRKTPNVEVDDPIETLRKSWAEKKEAFAEAVNDQIERHRRDAEEETIALSPERCNDDEDQTQWENTILGDIDRSVETTSTFPTLSSKVRRLLELYKKKDFAKWIPDNVKVDGLTYAEHKAQQEVNLASNSNIY